MHLLFDSSEKDDASGGLTVEQLFLELQNQTQSDNLQHASDSKELFRNAVDSQQTEPVHNRPAKRLQVADKDSVKRIPLKSRFVAGQRRPETVSKNHKTHQSFPEQKDYLDFDQKTLEDVKLMMKEVEKEGKRCREWTRSNVREWATSIRSKCNSEDSWFRKLPEIVAVISRANQLSTSLFNRSLKKFISLSPSP